MEENNNTYNGVYKLIGIINLFDIVPEFVIPVFENDGVYFTQGKTSLVKIESFDFLLNPNRIKYIRPITEYHLIMPKKKIEYSEGDNVLIAYQNNNKDLFLGEYKDFKKYINGIEITDDFMQNELPYVLKQMDRKRGQ